MQRHLHDAFSNRASERSRLTLYTTHTNAIFFSNKVAVLRAFISFFATTAVLLDIFSSVNCALFHFRPTSPSREKGLLSHIGDLVRRLKGFN